MDGQESPHTEDDYKAIMVFQGNKTAYSQFYLNALKFLCQPLVELVNSTKKQILLDIEAAPISSKLCAIQDAVLLLGDVFLVCQGSTSDQREKNDFDDSAKLVLSGAVAAFTLSFKTKHNTQESSNFIKHVISNRWFQHQGLEYLFASLYNIGVTLFRHNHVKEVSYKWLSRNYLVSSNAAKRLLQEFMEKNGSGLEVVYTLSGWLKNNPSVYHIQLVPGLKLAAYIEKEDSKKLKQKQRERMHPKMGKMVLLFRFFMMHFSNTTKPKLTNHGDFYHEGKEFEVLS